MVHLHCCRCSEERTSRWFIHNWRYFSVRSQSANQEVAEIPASVSRTECYHSMLSSYLISTFIYVSYHWRVSMGIIISEIQIKRIRRQQKLKFLRKFFSEGSVLLAEKLKLHSNFEHKCNFSIDKYCFVQVCPICCVWLHIKS